MIKVFISYRHADSFNIAGDIYRYLINVFGDDSIIWDNALKSENLGELVNLVGKCDVLLIIINREWERLLGNKDPDWVLEEIFNGLTTDGVLVIPVIINGTKFPETNNLPERIKAVTTKRGIFISEDPEQFEFDMSKLVDRIKTRHARFGGATGVFDNFPIEIVQKRFAKAKDHIRILCIWSSLWNVMQTELETAVKNGVKVDILLLNPDSVATGLRDIDLDERLGFTKENIEQNIKYFKHFATSLEKKDIDISRLQLRLYNATPARAIWIADESAFVGVHQVSVYSVKSPHTAVFGDKTALFKSMRDHFDTLWNSRKHTQIYTLT